MKGTKVKGSIPQTCSKFFPVIQKNWQEYARRVSKMKHIFKKIAEL